MEKIPETEQQTTYRLETRRMMIEKIFSGRFVFTATAAVLLYHGTVIGKFDPDQVVGIIKDVVIFYFVVKQAMGNNKTEVVK